jgi:hypothetical protein
VGRADRRLGTAGVWIGGWLSDRWGRAEVAVTIAFGSGVLSLLFGWLGMIGWWGVIAVGCLYGLLLAADSSSYSAQAAQAFAASTASSVAPVVAGVIHRMHSPSWVWWEFR